MSGAPRPQHCPGLRRVHAGLEVCSQRHACMRHYVTTDQQQPAHEPRFRMDGADCLDYLTWRSPGG